MDMLFLSANSPSKALTSFQVHGSSRAVSHGALPFTSPRPQGQYVTKMGQTKYSTMSSWTK